MTSNADAAMVNVRRFMGRVLQGLKHCSYRRHRARLKSCPDTNRSQVSTFQPRYDKKLKSSSGAAEAARLQNKCKASFSGSWEPSKRHQSQAFRTLCIRALSAKVANESCFASC